MGFVPSFFKAGFLALRVAVVKCFKGWVKLVAIALPLEVERKFYVPSKISSGNSESSSEYFLWHSEMQVFF